MKKRIKVAAAIIENEKGEILCSLRSAKMSMPNSWEFPGGKVEENENIYQALEREITEELGCKIKAQELFHKNLHEYDSFIIELFSIQSKIIAGVPAAKEHEKLIWLAPERLHILNWAPADVPIVRKLQRESGIFES